LKVPDGYIQSSAAVALERFGDDAKAAIPVLMGGLKMPPEFEIDDAALYEPRDAFIRALGVIGLGDPEVVELLISILEDDSRKLLHGAATNALGELGPYAQAAVPVLIEQLKTDNSPYGWYATSGALISIRPAGVTELLKVLDNPREDLSLQIHICNRLADVASQDERVSQIYLTLLEEPNTAIRECAAISLAKNAQNIELVLPILEDVLSRSISESFAILETMPNLGPSVVPLLLRVLGQKDLENRHYVIDTLRKVDLQNPQVLPAMIDALQDPSSGVRASAAEFLGHLKPADSKEVVVALVNLLREEIQPGADFRTWRQVAPGHFQSFSVPAREAFGALQELGPLADAAVPDLTSFLEHQDVFVRESAIRTLGSIGPKAISAAGKLMDALTDEDANVRIAAAQALLEIGFDLNDLDAVFTTVAIDDFINRRLNARYNEIADDLRPSNLMSGILGPQLPAFPWPPPRYSHIGVFGRDFDRNLLGSDRTTLGDVYMKLYQALFSIDPRFESGLFGSPGGFVMLSRLERIKPDGAPMPAEYRFAEGDIPPLNLIDALGRLFFEKPGHFRIIAFIVTTEANFDSSERELPSIQSGGTILPPDIANDTLEGKHVYALVYSFQRKRGGESKPFDTLSAPIHLNKAGILDALRQ
jgi:HEAT repeat protein